MSIEILDPVADVEEAAPSRRRLRKIGWLGWVSLAVIGFALLLAVLGPILRPFDPNTGDLSFANVGPYGSHLLGFDGQGRDVLSRLMVGARTTVLGAAFVAILAVTIGTTLAITTAWFGGKYDASVSAGIDVLFAFPGILLAVVAAAVFGPSLLSAGLALAIAYSPYVARVLRGAATQGAILGLYRRAGGAGLRRVAALRPAPAPEHLQPHRRAGHDPVRLRHGRPRRDLVPRPGRSDHRRPTGA